MKLPTKMNITKLYHRARSFMTLQNGVLAVAILIATGWLFGTVGTLQKNYLLQQQVDELQQKIQIAEIQNATLGFQRDYYKSDEYLELSARDKLGKANAGESLIVLPDYTAPAQTDTTSTASTSPSDTANFQQWMQFFFGTRE